MRHVLTLLARELAAYFLSPIAYLVLLAFQLIAAVNFYDLVDILSSPRSELSTLRDPMNTFIPGSPSFWIAIMVAIPLLTMRLFAEERRQGTIEALLTVPVTETEVVVAKWLAGVIMYCALLVPFFLYLPFLHFQAKYDFDLGPIMSRIGGTLDDGDDVRIDRLVPELAHAKSDHRGDLDIRRLAGSGGRFLRLSICSRNSSITGGRMGFVSSRCCFRCRASGRAFSIFAT